MQISVSSWQISKLMPPPLITSLPHISWNAPEGENFWTRLLFPSVTYTDPPPSTATAAGRFISPSSPPVIPALQVSIPARQTSKLVALSSGPVLTTSLPQARIGTPSSSNFWIRLLEASAT